MNPEQDLAIGQFVIEIGFFEQYLQDMESFLDDKQEYHSDRLRELQAEANGGELTPEQFEATAGEDKFYLESIDWYRDVLRKSFFVSLYSFLEHRLMTECRNKERLFAKRLKDVKAEGQLERIELFYASLKQPFPSDQPEREEIRQYRRLRNCVVHNHGLIEECREKEDLLAYVMGKRELLPLIADEVYFEEGFCVEAYQTVKDFLCLVLFGFRVG